MSNPTLTHEERVRVLSVLFSNVEPKPSEEDLEDLISCATMRVIKEYMYDVGITITQTAFGQTIHQSTVNHDSKWIARKTQALYDHLKSEFVGD